MAYADIHRSVSDSAQGLFILALQNFKSSLSEDDRVEFHDFRDAESMVKAINEQVSHTKEKNRLLACCRQIEKFAKKWEAFFEVINIFISTHPEWAGLAWGAIRLVFKVSARA